MVNEPYQQHGFSRTRSLQFVDNLFEPCITPPFLEDPRGTIQPRTPPRSRATYSVTPPRSREWAQHPTSTAAAPEVREVRNMHAAHASHASRASHATDLRTSMDILRSHANEAGPGRVGAMSPVRMDGFRVPTSPVRARDDRLRVYIHQSNSSAVREAFLARFF